MQATPDELEAYRHGYAAGIKAATSPPPGPPSSRQYLLAGGTMLVGLGGVAAIVSSRKKGGSGDVFAAFAIVAALLTSGLSAVRVIHGEPTPTLKLT